MTNCNHAPLWALLEHFDYLSDKANMVLENSILDDAERLAVQARKDSNRYAYMRLLAVLRVVEGREDNA